MKMPFHLEGMRTTIWSIMVPISLIKLKYSRPVVRLLRCQLHPRSHQHRLRRLPKNGKESAIHLALVAEMDVVQPSAPLLAARSRSANHCLR